MDAVRLDAPEAARILWEQAEAMERDARHLTEAATRLLHAARRMAVGLVEGRPRDPTELLLAAGAVLAISGQIRGAEQAIGDGVAELEIRLAPDPPSAVATAAIAELRQRLAARPLLCGGCRPWIRGRRRPAGPR